MIFDLSKSFSTGTADAMPCAEKTRWREIQLSERKCLSDLTDRLVNFRVSDAYMPDPREILSELHNDDVLQGRVLDLSDSGLSTQVYAVVKVEGVRQQVVVPIERILGVL
jgi:hypothetical protein